jgi:hypothetical protein
MSYQFVMAARLKVGGFWVTAPYSLVEVNDVSHLLTASIIKAKSRD